MSQQARFAYHQLAPRAFKALRTLTLDSGLEELLGARLVELVNLRVSQINGCGLCVDMHWDRLTREGMAARHVNAVAAWREAPFFSERERAALAWAEKVTQIPQTDPDDAAYAALKACFSDEEIGALAFCISAITAWNLLNVSSRTPMPEAAPLRA